MRTIRIALVAVMGVVGLAQTNPEKIGGTFGELEGPQQALVKRWVDEYREIFRRELKSEELYNMLPLSARTTFQAVTHALMNSKLTSADGKPMGTALDLVDMVERVSGHVPETRGDRQFRVYVYLKPGALNKLYAAKEFEREHDNTVFHIGYPMNFRQQGGVPSIQYSVARTGRRADIDVDYRSSAGVKALVSGHLTAANSDVRAGQNGMVHNRRWSGLPTWWQELMAAFVEKAEPEEPTEGIVPGAEMERRKIARGPIEEAIQEYLADWLVKQKPADLLPLVSIKAFPCVAEFNDGSKPDSRLALLRILRRMKDRNEQLGEVKSLEEVVSPVQYRLPDAVPLEHKYSKLFSLQEVPEDVAWAMDCRVRYKLQMAESVPRPSHKLNKTYVVSMRVKDPKEPQSFLLQTWRQEAGEWRLVSWDVKRKTMSPPADLLTSAGAMPAAGSEEKAVSSEAAKLLTLWLVKKQPGEAQRYFLPESYGCDAFREAGVPGSSGGKADDQKLRAFLEEAAKSAVPNAQLEGVIETVEAGHPDLRPFGHEHSGAFLLAGVSGDLVKMGDCGFAGKKSLAQGGNGGKGIVTVFRLVQTQGGEGAAITLYWKNSAEGWRVRSYVVASD